ncbi:zinc ribbon domain-containing protein [Chloroflexota bacterium]
MKCPNCQIENADGVKFCGQCGQPLKAEITCPECGHQNPANVKFCNECGHSLTESAASPTLGTPPPMAPPEPEVKQPISPPAPVPSELAPQSDDRFQIKRFPKIPRFHLSGVILGLLLLISVFLPWIGPSESWKDLLPSASGMTISNIIGLVGIFGGLTLIGVAFLPMVRLRKFIQTLVGLVALVAAGYTILSGAIPVFNFNGIIPEVDEFALSMITFKAGIFLYGAAIVSLLVIGSLKRKSR